MKKLASCFIITALVLLPAHLFAQQKYALVIGNGTYTGFGTLRNSVNDANDMADVLTSLGFTVEKIINGNLNQMENGAVKLKNRLSSSKGSYGFLFYAGHGVQMDGVNYLLPIDASIPDRSFLKTRAVSVQAVLDMLNDAGNALNVVVLDACRDFPAAWSRTTDRGLSVIASQPADSIIVYATAAGKTATDGTGRNGLFTEQLLKNLKTPGLDVSEVIRRTGADVARASGGDQRPATYYSFYDIVYLGTQPTAPVTTEPLPGREITGLAWSWKGITDYEHGGSSTINIAVVNDGGIITRYFYGNITDQYQYGFAGFQIIPDDEATLQMLRKANAISFKVKGDGQRYTVKVPTSDINDTCYYEAVFNTEKDKEVTVTIPMKALVQPPWGSYKKFNQQNAFMVEFQTINNSSIKPGTFGLIIWDFKIYQ